jgi:hypothetical protein
MAAVPERLLITRLKILTGRPEREVAGRVEHEPGSGSFLPMTRPVQRGLLPLLYMLLPILRGLSRSPLCEALCLSGGWAKYCLVHL